MDAAKLEQLAALLSDNAIKEFTAKALVQSLVLERGAPFDLETSWMLAPTQVKASYLAHVEHVVNLIRNPEKFGADETPRSPARKSGKGASRS